MYKYEKPTTTSIKVNTSYEGEMIETKVNRIVNNGEPINDAAPLIYTERKDGVEPAYNIRTDRFEIAVEAMDTVHKTNLAKRDEKAKIIGIDEKIETDKPKNEEIGKTEPVKTTSDNQKGSPK